MDKAVSFEFKVYCDACGKQLDVDVEVSKFGIGVLLKVAGHECIDKKNIAPLRHKIVSLIQRQHVVSVSGWR